MAAPSTLKMQLSTPASFTRDMTVELTNQVSGEKRSVKPYLDGSVTVPNIDPGQWRVQVRHPNLVFDVFDRPIKVLPDRPTFIPITIPQNIFENVPIADTPDADLGPVQSRLDDAVRQAEDQAKKKAGQPIFAEDWNELALTVSGAAKSARELTDLVSPRGHDHPEMVAKIEETQRNLQRMFDVFGETVAQIQRQIEQLALAGKLDSALDRIPNVSPATREQLASTVLELQNAWADSPGVYSAIKRRTAEKLQDQLSTILADQDPAVRNAQEVRELGAVTAAMATTPQTVSYQEELVQHKRITNQSTTGFVFDALKTRGR